MRALYTGFAGTENERMGIWRDNFSWNVLSRWDVLAVLVPGFPIAIGLGILGIDWFPQNLLISQICFAVAALILALKFTATARQATEQPLRSRVAFGVVVNCVLVLVTSFVIVNIQKHKAAAKENRERAEVFKTISGFISEKSEQELRETFDTDRVERDAFILAKQQLTPYAVSQIEIDDANRDLQDGAEVSVFYRYVDTSIPGRVSPLQGKQGFICITRKRSENIKRLEALSSSAFVPTDVSNALKELEKTVQGNNEVLIDAINEGYSSNPATLANAGKCPSNFCSDINNLFYSRFVSLKPKADAITELIRTHLEN